MGSNRVHEDVEKIAEEARNSISDICINECKAYCCRKGFLVLKEDEVDVVTQGKTKELEQKFVLKRLEDGKYSLNLSGVKGDEDSTCPSLKDNMCMIHKSKKRPKTCGDFPIFIDHEKKIVRLSPRCLAVKKDMFYPQVTQWMKLGYKIEEYSHLSSMELYTVSFQK